MDNENLLSQAQEMEILRERAIKLGISIPPNIKIETLRAKINEKLGTSTESSKNDEDKGTQVRKEALKLIRCQIVNLNPNKKNWPGEIITVWNKYTGTVKKFVPFGDKTLEGYHVPKIIFDTLKERKFLSITTKRGEQGKIQVSSRFVPEFALTVLPQLTKEELAELATAQKAAGSIQADETDALS